MDIHFKKKVRQEDVNLPELLYPCKTGRNPCDIGMGHLLSTEKNSALLTLCPVVYSDFLITLS